MTKAIAVQPIEHKVTHTGVITSILSSKGNGAIFKMDSIADKKVVSIKVKTDYNVLPTNPSTGEVWQVYGWFQKDPEHGEQLVAIDCYRKRPTGSILIQFLSNNSKFAGIGNTKAKRLWDAFGTNLYDVLDRSDIAAITDKKGGNLTESLAINLCEVWSTYTAETPVIEWLHRHNFPTRLVSKIIYFWGANAIAIITSDPYRMLAFEGWKKVDQLASDLGIPSDDERRRAAAIEATAYERYDLGNTAITETELRAGFNKKTSLCIRDVSELGDSINDRVVSVDDGATYQSIGAYALEKLVKERIIGSLKSSNLQESLFKPSFDIERLRKFEASTGFSLNKEQVHAVQTCLENNISCITGGAGVGKTTVLQAIFDQIGTCELIYQVALTGRAAKRMMEATGLEAKTIASFVLKAHDNEVQENCFLFIDEASMVDTPALYRLLKVTPPDSTICFVGDPYQLPPIGPGLPFKKLVDNRSGIIPVVELIETHRFAKETGILDVAGAIRRQSNNFQLDKFAGVANKDIGVSFIDAPETSKLIEYALKTHREFHHHGEVQILAPTNKLCNQVNGHLHNENIELRRYKKRPVPLVPITGTSITIGDPLLYRDRNDYAKELFNGSLGVLTDIYTTSIWSVDESGVECEYIAEADFDNGNIVKLTKDDFNYISLGYCITIHKSQGSQFQRIIFLCPQTDRKSRLDNSLIYTAITRAKRQVCVIGGRATFLRESAMPPRAFNRTVGLEF